LTGVLPAFLKVVQRELYFTTLDFLMKAIEAKETEIESADGQADLPRKQAQMAHLQRRLHVEFCYLASFADGGNEAL